MGLPCRTPVPVTRSVETQGLWVCPDSCPVCVFYKSRRRRVDSTPETPVSVLGFVLLGGESESEEGLFYLPITCLSGVGTPHCRSDSDSVRGVRRSGVRRLRESRGHGGGTFTLLIVPVSYRLRVPSGYPLRPEPVYGRSDVDGGKVGTPLRPFTGPQG